MSENLKNQVEANYPRATYRVQLRPDGFTLDDAAGIVGYLRRLGASHLYASPYLQAAPGSLHGYDVVDYQQVSADLGGEAAHTRLIGALDREGIGQVLDIVPNHMAISPQNPWWWDVLENGPSSRYASYFDFEWDPPETRHSNVILMPVLGDHYGRVLEAGDLRLEFGQDVFTIRYGDHVFPTDPQSLEAILTAAAERTNSSQLTFIAGAYGRLPEPAAADRASAIRRYRDKEVLRKLIGQLTREDPTVEQAIREVVADVNSNPDALDAFLRRQNYRPAWWRISARELGYRRFFDINTMIGLRMEDELVYGDTHRRVINWYQQGALNGLRIDHPDGLRDPQAYLARLRADAPEAWIVVEKILEHGEHLPVDWPVQGTTGYDFLNRVNSLFIDPRAEATLTDFYTSFSGCSTSFVELAREKKRQAANQVLGSDLNRLVELFLQVCERHRRYRDYTRNELHDTLVEVAACLPVYRTYIKPKEKLVTAANRTHLMQAITEAKMNRTDLDPRLLDFFGEILLLEVRGVIEADLVERFQQFTGPVMAKGVEDTTFYIYNRFVSLNEVGGDPGRFGIPVEDFHSACEKTLQDWPDAMLASATHDAKRGEDVRARLNVLSEIPQEWIAAVRRWAGMNEEYRSPAGEGANADGKWPDHNAEYLLYQTLVGAWPISAERMIEYMEKAGREAKEFTAWTAPNEKYEAAMQHFIRAILDDTAFTADLDNFVNHIREPGRINGLAQTLLKLTAPGVPDLYQGSEMWSLVLVDPDNRRPVDYDLLREMMDWLDRQPAVEQILARMDEGLPKLWTIRQALDLRRRRPELFDRQSSYRPLTVSMPGESGEPAVAFMRGNSLITAVPHLVLANREAWGTSVLDLPQGSWHNLLSGELLRGGSIPLSQLWNRFPVALLERERIE